MKKWRKLKKEFNDTFKDLSWKETRAVGKETLKDLKRPKEIFKLAAAAVTPGGAIAYPTYRIRKYRKDKKPKK